MKGKGVEFFINLPLVPHHWRRRKSEYPSEVPVTSGCRKIHRTFFASSPCWSEYFCSKDGDYFRYLKNWKMTVFLNGFFLKRKMTGNICHFLG